MKRYDVESVDPYDMEESADGTWCMYEDAQAAIQAAVLAERYDCVRTALRVKPTSDSPYALKTMIIEALEARSTP